MMGVFKLFCAGTNIDILPATIVKNILVNVPNEGANDHMISNTKRMFAYANTEHTFLDSGGFQLHEAQKNGKRITYNENLPLTFNPEGINITPEHVFDVAVKLKPDFMTSLDFPVQAVTAPSEQQAEFMKKMGFNIMWATRSAGLKKELCPQVSLLIPVQAFTLEHLDQFMHCIRDIEFDGLSMPTRNLGTKEIALFLTRFCQLGIKKVHILGSTVLFTMALGAYMARHYFEWVSVDSTSWVKSAKHGIYINPIDLTTGTSLREDVIIDETIQIDCTCPWCRGKTFSSIKHMPYYDKNALLRSHNFWVTEKAAADLYNHTDSISGLERHLRSRTANTAGINSLISTLHIIHALGSQDIKTLSKLLN